MGGISALWDRTRYVIGKLLNEVDEEIASSGTSMTRLGSPHLRRSRSGTWRQLQPVEKCRCIVAYGMRTECDNNGC